MRKLTDSSDPSASRGGCPPVEGVFHDVVADLVRDEVADVLFLFGPLPDVAGGDVEEGDLAIRDVISFINMILILLNNEKSGVMDGPD